jgi:hypothetical protein
MDVINCWQSLTIILYLINNRMQDVRVREGDTPGCFPPYSLCLYLCVCIYAYIYMYIYICVYIYTYTYTHIIYSKDDFSHQVSVHQVSPADQCGSETYSVHQFRSTYAATLTSQDISTKAHALSALCSQHLKTVPADFICSLCGLDMLQRLSYRIVLYGFHQQQQQQARRRRKNILLFLEDMVLREKFECPSSSYYWY